MENLKFEKPIINKETIQLRAKISESLSIIIRENTKCPKDKLNDYFTEDNVYNYVFENSNELDINELQNTIEKISNELNEQDFIKQILFNKEKSPNPSSMHKLMQNEYGLKGDMEFYISLFFVNLGGLIAFPEFCYRSIEEDMESDDCFVFTIKQK